MIHRRGTWLLNSIRLPSNGHRNHYHCPMARQGCCAVAFVTSYLVEVHTYVTHYRYIRSTDIHDSTQRKVESMLSRYQISISNSSKPPTKVWSFGHVRKFLRKEKGLLEYFSDQIGAAWTLETLNVEVNCSSNISNTKASFWSILLYGIHTSCDLWT